MAKLTTLEAKWSSAVLHDIFEAGGLIKDSLRKDTTNITKYWGYHEEAAAICKEIKFRNFDFPALDKAFSTLANSSRFTELRGNDSKMLNSTQLADIIANFCAEQEIYWDDINTDRTTTEMEVYRSSILGRACWEFGCFLSQQAAKADKKSRTKPSTPRVAGTAPKSGYKSSGPKSGFIGGLIGEPGEKIKLPTSNPVFVIVAESTKTKTQFVFVDPLAYKADVNKVRIGDPSGYSACKLFFDTIPAAEAALDKINKGSFTMPAEVTGFKIYKQSVDTNGYFKIETEIGPAYIKASKLNEAMKDVEESCNKKMESIADIEVYADAMNRYA